MTDRALSWVLVVTLGVPLGVGCDRSHRPNLLLITLDTTRADHCSLYGYDRPTTPVIDAL